MKPQPDRLCPNCRRVHLARGLFYLICLKCEYAERITTGRVVAKGKAQPVSPWTNL